MLLQLNTPVRNTSLMMMRWFLAALLVLSVCCVMASGAATLAQNRVKRDGGVITGALVSAGATLLTAGGSGSSTWELPSGQKIDALKCWEDGSGPCANGNCLDAGRRGIVLKETTVSCKWFCFHRAHCKTQICCPPS